MGKSQKLNQLLRKFLHKSHDDLQSNSSGRGRRLSGSSSGSSRVSSQRWTWSRMSTNSRADFELDCDCDCGDECWSSPPQDVPVGCFPVHVGEERRRFIIPTSYLTNSTFQVLLAKSEEEYGLRCEGGLRVACPPDAFEHLLWSLQGGATLAIERSFSGGSR